MIFPAFKCPELTWTHMKIAASKFGEALRKH
jgi:hypothetical protein